MGNFQGIACKCNGKWEGIVRLSGDSKAAREPQRSRKAARASLVPCYELAALLEDKLGARRAADRRVDEEVRGHRT